MHRLLRILLVPVLVALVTAACGGSGDDDAQTVGAADDQEQAAEQPQPEAPDVSPDTTLPAESAPTAVPAPVPVPPATVIAEPPVVEAPAQPASPAAPTTGRVDGTYTASDQSAHTEVLLRVAGGDPVASVQGTGDLPFAFDGVAPGRYVIEASERGPEVSDPNGAVTSSATTVRSAPFDLEAGYTWTFSCDTNGCGN